MPLAGGWLAGKERLAQPQTDTVRHTTPQSVS